MPPVATATNSTIITTTNKNNKILSNNVSLSLLTSSHQAKIHDRLKKELAIDKSTRSNAVIAPRKCFLLFCVLFLFSLDNCCLSQASASPVYPYYENTLDPIETRSFQFNQPVVVNNQLPYGDDDQLRWDVSSLVEVPWYSAASAQRDLKNDQQQPINWNQITSGESLEQPVAPPKELNNVERLKEYVQLLTALETYRSPSYMKRTLPKIHEDPSTNSDIYDSSSSYSMDPYGIPLDPVSYWRGKQPDTESGAATKRVDRGYGYRERLARVTR